MVCKIFANGNIEEKTSFSNLGNWRPQKGVAKKVMAKIYCEKFPIYFEKLFCGVHITKP